jgi:hypothetical protein
MSNGCPNCDDSVTVHDDEFVGEDMIKQYCECNGCGTEFAVTYKIVHVEVMEED